MSNVSGIIKSIQDIMRKDVGVDGDAQRISQLVWMFFLKIFDDREAEREVTEDNYQSPIPEHLRWRNWAANTEGITGEELSEFVNMQLFPTLKTHLVINTTSDKAEDIEKAKSALVIANIFKYAINFMKSGTLMRQVINKICEINFNNTQDRHTFGSIYEQILKDLQSAGNAGEFYTPRAVTKFIVDRVDPKLEESVLDPACGTGGFLACTIDHKKERYVKNNDDIAVLVKSIHGVEKKPLPHILCTTNMILHGIDAPIQIEYDNMLSRRPYKDYVEKDRVNVIVTKTNEIFCLMGSVILLKNSRAYSPNYLTRYLQTTLAQVWMTGASSATAVSALYLKDVAKLGVPIPPLAEQHRIVAKVDALMALCDQLKTRIQQVNQEQQAIADALVAQAVNQ